MTKHQPRKQRQPRTRKTTQKPLHQLLSEAVAPPNPRIEHQRLVETVATLVYQRDAALRELTDRANIEVYATRLKQLTGELREAIQKMDQAVRLVRRLVNIPPPDDDDLLTP